MKRNIFLEKKHINCNFMNIAVFRCQWHKLEDAKEWSFSSANCTVLGEVFSKIFRLRQSVNDYHTLPRLLFSYNLKSTDPRCFLYKVPQKFTNYFSLNCLIWFQPTSETENCYHYLLSLIFKSSVSIMTSISPHLILDDGKIVF